MYIFGEESTFSLHLLDENHGRKRAHDSNFIIMLIVINIMLVPRDLPQVSTTTTDTNFKLYDSCMPYMGMQQKPDKCIHRSIFVQNM
jgi:hypothetical protein